MRFRLIAILLLIYCSLSGQDTLFLKRKASYETQFFKAEFYKMRVSFQADSLILLSKRIESVINKWEGLCDDASQYHYYSLIIHADCIVIYATNYTALLPPNLGTLKGYSVINNKTTLIYEQETDSIPFPSPVSFELFTRTNKSRKFSYLEQGTLFTWKEDTISFMPRMPEDDVPSLLLCYKESTCTSTILNDPGIDTNMSYRVIAEYYPQAVDRYYITNGVLKNEIDSTVQLFQGCRSSQRYYFLYNDYQNDGTMILSFYEYPQDNSETITCWFYANHSIIYCCGIPPSYLLRFLEQEKMPIFINTHPYSFHSITENSTNSPSFIIHYYPSKWYSQETTDF